MFNLRGIEIRRDGMDKYIKLIVQVGYSDIYKVIEKKVNVPITKELVINYASSHYGIAADKIAWPHHIEVTDIE